MHIRRPTYQILHFSIDRLFVGCEKETILFHLLTHISIIHRIAHRFSNSFFPFRDVYYPNSFPNTFCHQANCKFRTHASCSISICLYMSNHFHLKKMPNHSIYYAWITQSMYLFLHKMFLDRASCHSKLILHICSRFCILFIRFHSVGCFSIVLHIDNHRLLRICHDHLKHCFLCLHHSNCRLFLWIYPFHYICRHQNYPKDSLHYQSIIFQIH